jgi:SAM-dependent methyltransferase
MSEKETLRREYAARFSGLEEYRDRVWQELCNTFFCRYIRPTDRVVDVGAGYGEFVRNIRAGDKHALDLNPDTASRVGPDTTFHLQDCSAPWPLDPGSVDVVFTSNFLEHLPDKAAIERTVTHAREALKPGGRIICLGPNIRYVPGDYWDYWDHHVAISDGSLAELLALKGYRVEQQIDRFLPYSMSGGFNPPIGFLKLYLKIPLLWRIVGKQFLVIARKSG